MVVPFNATEVPEPTGGDSLTSDLNIYYEVNFSSPKIAFFFFLNLRN